MISESTIDGCKRKEQVAYSECYKKTAPYVYSIISQYIKNKDFIKDAMQETYAQVFLSIDKYEKSRGSFKSWLSTIAVRQSINVLRKHISTLDLSPLNENQNIYQPVSDDIYSLDADNFNELIADMPTGYRTSILLFYLEGFTHKEIASKLDISINTSKSQLHRGLAWLKKNVSQHLKEYTHG